MELTTTLIKDQAIEKNHLPINNQNCRDFDDFQEVGRFIQTITFNHQWWAGDWLIYGEATFPDVCEQAIEVTGMAIQTLLNYRWVASVFPPERRCPELSFTAHKHIAGMTTEEQDAIIKLALDNGITESRGIIKLKAQLKDQIKIAVTNNEDESYSVDNDPSNPSDEELGYIENDPIYDMTEDDYEDIDDDYEAPISPGVLLEEAEKTWLGRLIKGGEGTLEKARVGIGAMKDHINPEDVAAIDRVIAQLKELRAWHCS